MTTSFGGVTIPNASPQEPKETAGSFEITIKAVGSKADYDALKALAGVATKTLLFWDGTTERYSIQTTGTKGSLVLEDGTTITNCVIMGPVSGRELPGSWNGAVQWEYTATFAKDTSL